MEKYKLRLYVVGYTPIARRAMRNLEEICAEPEVSERYEPEVIDLLERPALAEEEKILATPVLIKELPEPVRRIIGDLSEKEKVLVGLDVLKG